MKNLIKALIVVAVANAIIGCQEPPPPPPAKKPVHHAKAKSDNAEDFRAVEKPGSYGQ